MIILSYLYDSMWRIFFFYIALIYLLKFYIFIDSDWQYRNYQKKKNDSRRKIRKFRLASVPADKRTLTPLQTRRAACRPSSPRWCSLLNQRGIQMAADAPGIQIGAINPRKAALELQPNVSRPAITRPSPSPSPANCYRVRNIEANSFFRSRETINNMRLFFIRKKKREF